MEDVSGFRASGSSPLHIGHFANEPDNSEYQMSNTACDGTLRALEHSDQASFRDHLIRLDPECRLARFAMPTDEAFLRQYAQISFALDTDILGYFEDGILRGSAELRPIDVGASAEIAFAVERTQQRRGIGTLLMRRTLLAARERGIRRIYMNCLTANQAMQALACKFSTELAIEDGDVVGVLNANPPARPPRANGFEFALPASILAIGRRWLQPA